MDDKKILEECNKATKDAMRKFRYEAAAETTPSLLMGYRAGSPISGIGLGGTYGGEHIIRRMIEQQEATESDAAK